MSSSPNPPIYAEAGAGRKLCLSQWRDYLDFIQKTCNGAVIFEGKQVRTAGDRKKLLG